jgi:hypothetical protein
MTVINQQLCRVAIRRRLQGALVLHSRSANGPYPIPAHFPIPTFSDVFRIHAQLLSGNYREEHNRR